MAELTPLSTSQRPTDGAYQPVSGFAVAAIIVTGIFSLGLLGIFYSAFTSSRTPMTYELLFIAIVGFGLAIAARVHLKRSEGTRTGYGLANTAWWVCVLGGVGYAAFLYANEYFIQRESNEFAEKFFDQLKADKPHHAMMFVLEPAQRSAANPDNPEQFESAYAPLFGPFRNHELVRQFRRNGKNIELEHVSAVDIGQEAEGFKATHIYSLKTPEGIFEARLGLKAAEAKKGGKPQWRVNSKPTLAMSLSPRELSEYGRLLVDLEGEVNSMVRDWTMSISRGQRFRAQVMTLPGNLREQMDQAIVNLALVGGGPGTIWNFAPGFLPEDRRKTPEAINTAALAVSGTLPTKFATFIDTTSELLDAGFFKRDLGETPLTPEQIALIRKYWRRAQMTLWRPENPSPPETLAPEPTRFIIEDNEIKVIVPIDWQPMETRGLIKASAVLSCTNPEVIRILKEAQARGYKSPDRSNLTLRELPSRQWTIKNLLSDVVLIAPPSGPGGGPPR